MPGGPWIRWVEQRLPGRIHEMVLREASVSAWGRTVEARNTSRMVGKLWAEAMVKLEAAGTLKEGCKLGTNGGGAHCGLQMEGTLGLFHIEKDVRAGSMQVNFLPAGKDFRVAVGNNDPQS